MVKVFRQCVAEIHNWDFTLSDFVTGWNLRSMKANGEVKKRRTSTASHLPPWGWSQILFSLTSCELGWAVLRSQRNLSPAKKQKTWFVNCLKKKKENIYNNVASAGVVFDHCGALQSKGRFDLVFTAFVDGFIRLQWNKSIEQKDKEVLREAVLIFKSHTDLGQTLPYSSV